jgi:O-antigen chain-terminating methyltransferase
VRPDLPAWLGALDGDDAEVVERLWRLVLRRDAEPEARERTVERLAKGMSRAALLQELVESAEFARVRTFDDGLALAAAARRAPRKVRGPARPRSLEAAAATEERFVEIPWVLARYDGEQRVLDVGYAFAEPAYLAGLVALGASGLTGVDLAEADVPGLRSVAGDVRQLPFEDGSFDLVLCVSTLEHVGRDNTVYGLAREADDEGLDTALRELRRVLARRGRLLVTVPCGEAEDLGSQVQLEPRGWIRRFQQAGLLVFEDELYELTPDGWRSVTLLTPGLRYGDRGPGASAVLCAELRRSGVAERLRVWVRDLRHRGEPRRSI